MESTKTLIEKSTQEEKKALFIEEAKRMWSIKDNGIMRSLPIDFQALKNEGMLNGHVEKIKKYFKSKTTGSVKNVTYYYLQKDGKLEIFLEESDGLFDWKQNLLAFTIKVRIGGIYRRYHLGFFATSVTVFEDLKKKGLLTSETMVEVYGYSHGAGACPSFYSLVLHRSEANIIDSIVKFEPPRDAFYPNERLKKECKNHFNFIQGNDIVTKIPWWMKSLGIKIKVKGQKLSWLKGAFKSVFDHDIYWTDEGKA